MIKKQKFTLPDGAGGGDILFFEISAADNEPPNPATKQIWFDATTRTIKVFNATTGLWENFELPSSSEPANPVNNQTWFDVSDKTIKIYNSTTGQWEIFVAKPVKVSITIPTSGWVYVSSESSDYKYYYQIPVSGLKTDDIVEIFYSRSSIETVLEAGVCPSDNQALSGSFRVYAAAVPAKAINATYVVWKG